MLEQIVDHAIKGVLKFVPPFWGKPRMATLLVGPLNEVQELEDTTFAVIDIRQLDNADDERLRILGDLVGQGNFGFSTEEYRSAIRARVQANRSNGRINDIHTVIGLIVPLETWTLYRVAPADLAVQFIDSSGVPTAVLRDLLASTKAAGVGLVLFVGEQGDDDLQVFARHEAALPVEGTWGFSGDPTVGKKLFHAVAIEV